MIKQEQWRLVKEEFGFEEARKRIETSLFNGVSTSFERELNESLIIFLINKGKIQLKSATELFNHDCEVYGENAHLMWEISTVKNGRNFINCTSNLEMLYPAALKRRKTSAALPFDLERAKTGDVVEYKKPNGEWDVLKEHKFIDVKSKTVKTVFKSANYCTHIDNLRMKYPPKKQTGGV